MIAQKQLIKLEGEEHLIISEESQSRSKEGGLRAEGYRGTGLSVNSRVEHRKRRHEIALPPLLFLWKRSGKVTGEGLQQKQLKLVFDH